MVISYGHIGKVITLAYCASVCMHNIEDGSSDPQYRLLLVWRKGCCYRACANLAAGNICQHRSCAACKDPVAATGETLMEMGHSDGVIAMFPVTCSSA